MEELNGWDHCLDELLHCVDAPVYVRWNFSENSPHWYHSKTRLPVISSWRFSPLVLRLDKTRTPQMNLFLETLSLSWENISEHENVFELLIRFRHEVLLFSIICHIIIELLQTFHAPRLSIIPLLSFSSLVWAQLDVHKASADWLVHHQDNPHSLQVSNFEFKRSLLLV